MPSPILHPWNFNNNVIFGLGSPPATNDNKSYAVNVGFLNQELAKIPNLITTHEGTVNHPLATPLSKGLLSPTDKTQLDNLAANLQNKQALSSLLSAIALLTSRGILEIKSDNTVATVTVSDAAKTLLDDQDIPAIRTTLGLGDAATKSIGNTAGSVAAGNDPRLTDSRSPIGIASGDFTGSYPSPVLVPTGITPGVYTKITFDAKGRALSGDSLVASDIPNLDAAKIVSGTFPITRLPVGTTANSVAAGDDLRFPIIGSTPPTNPPVGRLWWELNTSNQFVMSWYWNGTYWLSTDLFWKEHSLVNLSAVANFYYEIPSEYNVFLSNFKINVLLGGTNNAANNWIYSLQRVGTVGTVSLGSINTSNGTAGAWFSNTQSLNTHLNVASTGSRAFRFDLGRTGNPSNTNGSLQVNYRMARI